MRIDISETPKTLGGKAAAEAADCLVKIIAENGRANLIVATGASQFQTLAGVVADDRIDWTKVTGFHLDEYIGLAQSHPASFRRYLRERFVQHVPIANFHYVDGEASDPQAECKRLEELIVRHPVDLALVGIGENGHLAFNDPPADFETESAYLVVELDDACRRQQHGEGWFETFDDVPSQAISMSIRQIMKTKQDHLFGT